MVALTVQFFEHVRLFLQLQFAVGKEKTIVSTIVQNT